MGEKVFTLRMDEDIFNQVKISADKNKRSIAKEIEFILDRHFNTDFNFAEKFLNAAERSEIFKQAWDEFWENKK